MAGQPEEKLAVCTEGAADDGDRATSDHPASTVLRCAPARGGEPLHAVIERSRAAIVEQFVCTLRDENLTRRDAPRADVIDDLAFFLGDLADALRGATPTPTEHARHHGNRRHRLGFDLGAVLREYSVLRRCIHVAVRNAGAVATPEEIAQLDRAIDDAMVEAAFAYVEDCDGELRAEREALKVERQLLQRAVASRDELLAIVSHDLRNPLTSISLGVDQLRRNGAGEPSRRERILDSLTRSAQRMTRLIEDLLAMAKYDAGQLSVERAPHPAAALFDDALSVVRPLSDAKAIRLNAAIADLTLSCDRERMMQVLGNLLGNAIKFTPAQGEIHVEARRDGDVARVLVRDTGPGIPSDVLPYVFDRFYQGATHRSDGAGLGLAIARAIVEAHGGTITVESASGAGTTFSFTVPLA